MSQIESKIETERGSSGGIYLLPVGIVTVYIVGKYLYHLREYSPYKGTVNPTHSERKQKRE